MRKKIRKWLRKNLMVISFVISLLGIGLIIGFACHKSFNGGGEIDPQLASQYGEFISGVAGSLFTLVGFLLLYQTILEQRDQFNIQQFESKLFEMIKFHRDNIETTTFITPYMKKKTIVTGRNAFIDMKNQCVDIYNECRECPLLKGKDQKEIIKISYLLFFFGVSKRTMGTTICQLKTHNLLSEEDANAVINKVREKKTKYDKNIVFYGGHQSKLGFYFRHMYRTVKFIDDNGCLNTKQKSEYIKLFRSQFTTYEQGILFFNSISQLGDVWKDLVRDYELIKNIPPEFLSNIIINNYYSKFNFEFSGEITNNSNRTP